MRKILFISCIASIACFANQAANLEVSTKKYIDGEVKKDGMENMASLDLATALSKSLPEVTYKRTTGYGQDIYVRGFGYENVNIEIDGAKLYGACPNHMDPPLAHIFEGEIDSISLIKGPFDVSSFGNMGAKTAIKTHSPKDGFSAKVNVKYGSFNMQQYQANISGGTKEIKLYAAAGYITQKPYDDADGNNIVEAKSMPTYKSGTKYEKLYKISSYQAKTEISPSNTLKINAGVAVTKNDQALYPGKMMDATKDDTTRVDASISLYSLGAFSDELRLSGYKNSVKHDMDNFSFRNTMNKAKTDAESEIGGLKLQNSKKYSGFNINYGVDGFVRTWEATNLFGQNLATSAKMLDSKITDFGIFIDTKIPVSNLLFSAGLRSDWLKYKNENSNINAIKAVYGNFDEEQDDTTIGGYLKAEYFVTDKNKIFLGFGRAARTPDPVELYIVAQQGNWIGNPNLKPSINNEIDLGAELNFGKYSIAPTLFYSSIQDYIYPIKLPNNKRSYENINAYIYGIDCRSMIELTKELSIQNGLSYQVGRKKDTPTGINDKDLAEIPPFKFMSNITYNQKVWSLSLGVIAVASQNKVDSDLNEQKSKGYGVINLSGTYEPIKNLTISGGIDNILNQKYSLFTGYDRNPINPTIYSINEPGRSFFVGASYKF